MLSESIKTRIKADLLNYHLSPFGFAEPVTYTPYGGNPRTVYMYIEEGLRLDVSSGNYGGDTMTEVEEITCLAARDESATDSNGTVIGGVSRPQNGDKITRSSSFDPEGRDYVFAGELELRSDIQIEMKFHRYKRDSQALGVP